MPVTTFALLLIGTVIAAALTVWALTVWGALTVFPVLMVLALLARWALAHVPHDDANS